MPDTNESSLAWSLRLTNSNVPHLLDQVNELLAAEYSGTPAAAENLYRMRRIAASVGLVLREADPALISDGVLGLLNQHLANSHSYLAQWRASNDEGQLQAALQQLDESLSAIARVPLADLSGASDIELAELRRVVHELREHAAAQVEELRAAVSQAQGAISEQVQTNANVVNEIHAEVTSSRDEHRSLLENARQLADGYQREFTSGQDERSTAFDALMADHRKKNADANSELGQITQQRLDSIEQLTSEAREHFLAKKEEVDGIVGLISEEALVGSYESEAKHERKQANTLRLVSIVSVVASVAMGLSLFWGINTTDVGWAYLLTRIVLLAPLGAVAAYTAKQSSEHRHAERDSRHLGLQLKAFGPYLQHLPDQTKRDELVKEIAERIFGQPRAGRLAKQEGSSRFVGMRSV